MRALLSAAAFVFAAASAASVPESIPWKSWSFCKELKPDENNVCLARAIESAVKNDLVKGNSYFGTPTLDPLEIPQLSIYNEGQNRAVAVNITFKNGTLEGMSKFIIKDLKTEWSKGHIVGDIFFPDPVIFNTDYEISGKVILLPINGKGRATFVLEEMTSILGGDLMEIEKNNKKHFKPRALPLEIKPKKLTMNFEKLFGGNKQLNTQMNNFLNENWNVVFDEIGPFIAQGLSEAFKRIATRVYGKVPVDVMVPK